MAETKTNRPNRAAPSILVRLGNDAWQVHQHGEKDNPGVPLDAVHYTGDLPLRPLSSPKTGKPITLQSVQRDRPLRDAQAAHFISQQTPLKRAPSAPSKRRFRGSRAYRRAPWSRLLRRVILLVTAYIHQVLLPKQERRNMAGLKGGLVVGMVLGCLAVFLFHQMAPALAYNLPKSPVTTNEATPIVDTSVKKTMNLSGFRLYMVNYGSYATAGQAARRQADLAHKGVMSTVFPVQGFSVVSQVAVVQADAQPLVNSAEKNDKSVSVLTLQQTARVVPVLASADDSTVQATGHFFSEATSGLLSLVAWLSDNGASADASQSVQTAVRDFPGDGVAATAGISNELESLRTLLVSAQLSLTKKDKVQVEKYVLQGFLELTRFQGINAGV